MWRPGKRVIPLCEKNHLHTCRPRSPDARALGGAPLPGLQLRSGYALPASQARQELLILIVAPLRIASPELLLDAGPLPHLICSPPRLGGGGRDEAGEHGDAR